METLYLKLREHEEVYDTSVTLENLGEMWCSDKDIEEKCRKLIVYNIEPRDGNKNVGSILQILPKLQKEVPDVEVENLGETDFVIEYRTLQDSKFSAFIKVVFVSVIAFIGAAFAIMTFNNDGDVANIFDTLTVLLTGQETQGISVMEVAYAVGLPVGILVFFNHFNKKQVTKDPTPIEVQMRLYEDDVCHTFVENNDKKVARNTINQRKSSNGEENNDS